MVKQRSSITRMVKKILIYDFHWQHDCNQLYLELYIHATVFTIVIHVIMKKRYKNHTLSIFYSEAVKDGIAHHGKY